jgi:polyisoprenoid-binding protein YceI
MKTLSLIAASLMLNFGAYAADSAKIESKTEAKTEAKTAAKPAKKTVKTEAKEKNESIKLKVDTSASKVTWTGKKLAGSHNGTVPVKSGEFEVKPDGKASGEVVIDLANLKNDDLTDAEYNKKLVGHLKSPDFFDTEKYPTATYQIEQLKELKGVKAGEPNALATGKLTIHGITKPYETKVFYVPSAEGATIKGKLEIERTQYGLKYNSKKFFDAKALGDKLIDDKFEVNLDLVAKK